MRRTTSVVCLLAVLLVAMAFNRTLAQESKADATAVITKVYKTHHLPVYDKAGKWKSEMLMAFIQSAVLPEVWEAKGGNSTMAPYAQKKSIVISTTAKAHDAIAKLLESYRS